MVPFTAAGDREGAEVWEAWLCRICGIHGDGYLPGGWERRPVACETALRRKHTTVPSSRQATGHLHKAVPALAVLQTG